MDNIVAQTFEILRPHLSPALFTPAAVHRLRHVARRIVPVPAVRLGFECRLGRDASQVDLQQGILAGDGEPLALVRFIDRILPGLSLSVAQVWRRVRALGVSWADPTSPLYHGLRDIWLEFDVIGDASPSHVPSIFLGLRDEVSRPQERFAVIQSALRTLTENEVPESVQGTLRLCCDACPPGAGATHVGLMLSRAPDLLRLNVVGLSAQDAPLYLERIGWPGPMAEGRALLDGVMQLPVRVRVCLDVGAQVQATLGFECLFGDAPEVELRLAAVLDTMVSQGLCTPDKREAVLAWSGCVSPRSCTSAWPDRLIGESLLRQRNEFAVLDRQWSHIKVTYAPQRDTQGRIEAKAYIGALYTWIRTEADPQSVGPARPEKIRDGIDRAVAFLLANQLPHGEFPSYRFASPECATRGRFDSSPFVTCFVLEALALAHALVDPPEVAGAIRKGVEFLLEEREEPGVWRYWTSRNRDKIDLDLDDTACASFTVQRLAGEPWVAGNRAMILANRTAEGLFKTWLRPPEAPNVIDLVVNANVVLYLGECRETAAAIDTINHVIAADAEEHSYWFYLDPLALYYMVSRAAAHGVAGLAPSREDVVRKTLARQKSNGSFGNELLTGLALCTLLNYAVCDEAVNRGIAYLVHTQQRPGSWRHRAFYGGPDPPAPRYIWWGAEAMTTALCLEALVKAVGRREP